MAESILGRIGRLMGANVDGLVEAAEDPERAIDQLLRDYAANIAEAEAAVAQTIGTLRRLEDDQQAAAGAVREWGEKAIAASRKADQLRAAGQAAEADRFDDLAKVALGRQIEHEGQAKILDGQVAQQRDLTDQLKAGLEKLRDRHADLIRRRDELAGRSKMAQAQIRVQRSLENVSALDPTSALDRLEDRVIGEEAQAQGVSAAGALSFDEQMAQIEAQEDEREVAARLARLKAGGSGEARPASASSSSQERRSEEGA